MSNSRDKSAILIKKIPIVLDCEAKLYDMIKREIQSLNLGPLKHLNMLARKSDENKTVGFVHLAWRADNVGIIDFGYWIFHK